mmetsp:Transcript_15174/g.45752  ORF Transcript_15174/g.45752 Transcript_15174/m.45752 type:complete len:81 (+) Transcript_15174:321-563(+)
MSWSKGSEAASNPEEASVSKVGLRLLSAALSGASSGVGNDGVGLLRWRRREEAEVGLKELGAAVKAADVGHVVFPHLILQ